MSKVSEYGRTRRQRFAGDRKHITMVTNQTVKKRQALESIDGNIQIEPSVILLPKTRRQGNKKLNRSNSIDLLCGVLRQVSLEHENPPEKDGKLPQGVINIDENQDDPANCNPYARDITSYMKKLEKNEELKIQSDYLKTCQNSISDEMRSVLIDWLLQAQHFLELLPETIYKTVVLLDRFLSVRKVSGKNLQLVGLTCLFIASKFVEQAPPQVFTLTNLSDDCYTYEEIIKTEWVILKKLKFHLSSCDPSFFIARLLQASNVDLTDKADKILVKHLTYYFVDQMIPFSETLNHLPSKLSASGLCLARYLTFLNKSGIFCSDQWTNTLQYYSSYKIKSLQLIIKRMAKLTLHVRSSTLQGAYRNYSSRSKYNNLSNELLHTHVDILTNVAVNGI